MHRWLQQFGLACAVTAAAAFAEPGVAVAAQLSSASQPSPGRPAFDRTTSSAKSASTPSPSGARGADRLGRLTEAAGSRVTTARAGANGTFVGQRGSAASSGHSAPSHGELDAKLNKSLATEFPRLAIVLRNPDAFVAKMTERFEQQKQLTPSDPYRFNYSEVGMPLLKDMRAELGSKLSELSQGKGKASPSDRQIAIQHLSALANEADHHLQSGAVSYRNVIEFSHFYSRAIGQFDKAQFSPLKRGFLKIDERLEGFKQLSPAKEFADYKDRNFSVFDPSKQTKSAGFSAAQPSFQKAVFAPDGLKTVIVPTNTSISQHVLLRLSSREKINIVGVTAKPILADGFLRPSGLFWTHDLRHQSVKFYRKEGYIEREKLSPRDVDHLNHMMDGFYVELRKETEGVRDPQLREAIKLLTFNYFFDRGHPMVPSSYLDRTKDNVTHALYFAEKFGGQEVKFKAPMRNLRAADEWMKRFWEQRRSIESDFLAKRTSESKTR